MKHLHKLMGVIHKHLNLMETSTQIVGVIHETFKLIRECPG